MLRITTRNNSGAISFVVEGKLAGACVNELEKCWQAAAVTESQRSILVDLTSVTFIDVTGKQLLTRMHEQGTRLVATGLMTKSLVEEIERRGNIRKGAATPLD